MLRVDKLTVSYGAAIAVRGATFEAMPRQVTALLGANGAGKTTMMLALSGLLPVRGGDIIFNGMSIRNLNNERLVRLESSKCHKDARCSGR
jgi:branched-chain amino acid transport system ATP-binding protein